MIWCVMSRCGTIYTIYGINERMEYVLIMMMTMNVRL